MRSATACAALIVVSLAATVGAAQPGTVEVTAGSTQLRLNAHVLGDLGVELFATGAGDADEHAGIGEFEILPSERLSVALPGGSYRGPVAGRLVHGGGPEIRWEGGRLSLVEFELWPTTPPDTFELRTADGSVVFVLDNAHPQVGSDGRHLLLLNMDLRLSRELAERLDRPELEGLAVGEAHVAAQVVEVSDGAFLPGISVPSDVTCAEDFSGPTDIRLEAIESVSETVHTADRVALAPSATLMNVGTADVAWYRSIEPDGQPGIFDEVGEHPFLVMNMYRTFDGRIEQIGRSAVKHAFFSTNENCDCSPAQVLFGHGRGCTDRYGASTNSHRKYLAPRDEVTASTGAWERVGSHFDGVPVDDYRDHDETDHSDLFTHRLSVASADLEIPGAEYRVEAWYLVKDDIDIFNSMGHRKVTPFFGGIWSFPFADPVLIHGSVLDAWVDPLAPPPGTSNVAIPVGVEEDAVDYEGQLQLAVQATTLPGGIYRYEYALMNHDFDRQVDAFTVPLPASGPDPLLVQSTWFGDGDATAGADWTPTVDSGSVTWSAPAGTGLDWGTLYNFSLEVNAAPDDGTAILGVLEPGSPGQLSADVTAPSTTFPAAVVEVALGGSGSGSVASSPVGIDCGSDCAEVVAVGLELDLTAAASAGSAFMRWQANSSTVSHELSYGQTVGGDFDLTAVFDACEADVVLEPQTVNVPAVFAACNSLTAATGVEIASEAVFRAGERVVLGDGFTVAAAAVLVAEIVPEQAIVPIE